MFLWCDIVPRDSAFAMAAAVSPRADAGITYVHGYKRAIIETTLRVTLIAIARQSSNQAMERTADRCARHF